jgi:hypothetical protein
MKNEGGHSNIKATGIIAFLRRMEEEDDNQEEDA